MMPNDEWMMRDSDEDRLGRTRRHEKVWTCRNCNLKFVPNRPDFSCPSCRSTTTFPTSETSDSQTVGVIKRHERVCQFQVENENTIKGVEYFRCRLTGIGTTRSIAGMDY
ncbi:MAG: hypothetical protein NWE83_00645, partial [Candidatus Bathyarchaeota archaeon]|nr:hypothetical protein [Candidatus Bathyarchaeota archaeon]